MRSIELTMKIAPLNVTQDDLDQLYELLAPVAEKITEIEARENGEQLRRLKRSFTIDPRCPAIIVGPYGNSEGVVACDG